MIKFSTCANSDPVLAAALGRFSQSCVNLERNIETSLFRLLPVTDDIGRVLLSGNQMRRNIEIMRALTELADVPLKDEIREPIRQLCTRCIKINEDRSRILHNPIVPGDDSPQTYLLVQHKSDGKNSQALAISTEMISELAKEANGLVAELITVIPSLDYDTTAWVRASPRYPLKEYPVSQQKGPKQTGARKQNPPQKSAVRKTKQ